MARLERCPHPTAREQHHIIVGGRMAMCKVCYDTLGATIRAWHAYSIKPSTVYRRLRMLEYSRRDALRFLVQLIADRAQVRLGMLARGKIDV